MPLTRNKTTEVIKATKKKQLEELKEAMGKWQLTCYYYACLRSEYS